jgi:hypothetical protein
MRIMYVLVCVILYSTPVYAGCMSTKFRNLDLILLTSTRNTGSRILTISTTVPLVKRKSRMLKPLAFDEYCRFDTSAFF